MDGTFAAQYKHPLWQKRRLEVMEDARAADMSGPIAFTGEKSHSVIAGKSAARMVAESYKHTDTSSEWA